MRTFEDKQAVRSRVPLLGSLMGPSCGGKTFSALRLATGMQRVTGGDIHFIDTEGNRALHYADDFKFRHVEFSAPFCPLDYLAAIEHSVKRGAGIIIIDSMSHEHEGPGGVLEQHTAEVERLTAAWSRNGRQASSEAANFPAWAEPKARRRRLLNTVVQLGVNTIFCFRAKEKSKPFKRGDVVNGERQERAGLLELGWMPIAGDDFVYEMGFNLLLESNSNGVPNLSPQGAGTEKISKLPKQFKSIITPGKQLDESVGEALARWATGTQVPTTKQQRPRGDIEDAETRLSIAQPDEIPLLLTEMREYQWTSEEKQRIAKYAPKKPASEPNPDDDGRDSR